MRRWLGIVEPEKIRTDPIELRRLVGQAPMAAFSNERDYDSLYGMFFPGFKNTVTTALESASVETATRVAKHEIRNEIGCEKFIDDVVERINKKQIRRGR